MLLASWLLGFLSFRLLGFLASRLLGFWAFRLFVGLCGFCSAFTVPLGFLAFAPSHWFWDLASRIISITSSSLFESSLLRTSWGGHGGTPNPLLFRLFAEQLHPCLNQHFFRHHGGGCRRPQPPRYFLDFLQRLNCTRIWIITFSSVQFCEKMLQNTVSLVICVIHVCLYV